MLSHEEQRELLKIAREAIEHALQGEVSRHRKPVTGELAQRRGAFVTIRIESELRGCIGYIESEKTLAEVVAEVAAKAATEDPRFEPLTPSELQSAQLEVSVLTPLRRIASIEELEVGVHGLVVALDERRGLLLPQVAKEHHLNREAFLEATLRKAGLPPSAMQLPEMAEDIDLYVFEAEVLHESATEQNVRMTMIRKPAVAGTFYPADTDELHQQITDLMQQVKKKKRRGSIRGIVCPHAGYMYSGLTAAYGYSMLRGEQFETVVVVSPSHREFFKGVSVYSGDAYQTPLGIIKVNKPLREALLAADDFIVASEAGHHAEHGLEVQLPFLQEVLGEFTLLPLVIGDQQPDYCFKLGEALAKILKDENALLVASTDLSHFYSAEEANRLDGVMIRDINEFNDEQLMRDLQTQRTEACGGGPAVAVMSALKRLGVKHIEVVHHSNSGDITGDYSSVVGYLSAVAYT